MRSQSGPAPHRPGDRTVLVLGATGRVGSVVVRDLLRPGGPRVLLGSRHPDRARAPAGAVPVRVDVGDPDAVRRVLADTGADVVVLCVEPPDEGVHRACLEAGVSVVDVCATPEQISRIERLDPVAEAAGATVLLSIGVAPGLTNHLAAQVHADLGGADRLDLTVLLGAGEAHGDDAVRWTLDGLARDPAGTPAAVRTHLPGFGSRRTHPMPFSDQVSLARTLGVERVTTRMCLDSRAVSSALFALAGSRPGRRVLGSGAARRLMTASSGRVPLGTETFLVMAEGHRAGRTRRRWAAGRAQSRATGLVASLATGVLLDGGADPGVRHLDEVPALMAAVPTLGGSVLDFGWQ